MSAPATASRLRRLGRRRRYRHALTPWPHRRGRSFGHDSASAAGSGSLPSTVGGAVPWFTLVRPCPKRFTLAKAANVPPPLHADVAGVLDEVAGPGRLTLCGPLWPSVVDLWPAERLALPRLAGRRAGVPRRATEAGPPGDAAGEGGGATRGCRGRRREGHQGIPRATETGPPGDSAGGRETGRNALRRRVRAPSLPHRCAGAEQALQACRRLQHLSQATRRRRR